MIFTNCSFEYSFKTWLAAPDEFILVLRHICQVEVEAVQVEPSLAAVAADGGDGAPHVVLTHSARLVPGITHYDGQGNDGTWEFQMEAAAPRPYTQFFAGTCSHM